jgi:hypothetical protein
MLKIIKPILTRTKLVSTFLVLICILSFLPFKAFALSGGINSTWVHGTAIITSTQLSNGNVLLAGQGGKWQIITSSGTNVTNGTWVHGSSEILRASAGFSNGNVLLAGNDGKWAIITSTGANVNCDSMYQFGSIFTATQLSNGNVLLASTYGKWQIITNSGSYLDGGYWVHDTAIITSTQLSNGNILLAGNEGKWQIITSSGTNVANGTWTHGEFCPIYIATQLSNGNVLLAGQGGKWQIITSSGTNVTNGTWVHGSSYHINTSTQLLNNKIILAGNDGKWAIITNTGANVSNGTWANGTTNISTALQIQNYNILMAGGPIYQIYINNKAPTLTFSNKKGTSIDINITPSNDVANIYTVIRATNVAFTQNLTTVRNAVSGLSFTDSGLTPNTLYYYRIYGESPEKIATPTSTKYQRTLANTPSLTFGTPTTSTIPITINTNGNPSDTQYLIERSPSGTGSWTIVRNWSTATSFTDSSLASGTAYYYRSKARNGGNEETPYSSVVSKVTIPGAVTGLTQVTSVTKWDKENGRIKVVLNWTKPTGATGYLVKVHDGYDWRLFKVSDGNTTTWDSSVQKIYPSETVLNGYSTGTRTIDLFNYNKAGLDLRDDPRNLYRSALESPYTNIQYYMFDVQAYGANGSTLPGPSNKINSTVTSAVDLDPPTGTISVVSLDGQAKTTSVNVKLNVTGSDAKSGLDKVQYSNNLVTWSNLETLTSPKSWTLTPGAGTKTVYMKLIDKAGNEYITCDDIYYMDDTAGSNVTLSINEGADSTTNPNVNLNIKAIDDFSKSSELKMRFSNDGNKWSAWESFCSTKTWNITTVNYGGTTSPGIKLVYVQVKDTAQNIGSAQASIGYNTQKPTGTVSTDSGIVGCFNGDTVRFVNNPKISLSLNFSNAAYMRTVFDGTTYNQWQPYESTLPIILPKGDGLTTVGIQVQDNNKIISDFNNNIYPFVLDTTPPIVFVKTANGATATKTGSVTLILSVTDNISIGGFYYRINNGSWIALPANGQVIANNLAKGLRNIKIDVKDRAGNIGTGDINIWSL